MMPRAEEVTALPAQTVTRVEPGPFARPRLNATQALKGRESRKASPRCALQPLHDLADLTFDLCPCVHISSGLDRQWWVEACIDTVGRQGRRAACGRRYTDEPLLLLFSTCGHGEDTGGRLRALIPRGQVSESSRLLCGV
jgi:hypothetical protein